MRKFLMQVMSLVCWAGAAEALTFSGIDQQRISLGSAFDRDGSHILPRKCVTGTERVVTNRRATYHFDYAKDFQSQKKSLDRLGGAGFDIGIVAASGSVQYLSRVARGSLRESLLLEFHVQDGSILLAPGVSARDDLPLAGASPLQKREICGTEFIQQADLGYRFFLNLTLNFKDSESYERYQEETRKSVLFGLISSQSTSVNELKSFGKNLYIEIDSLQLGGDDSFVVDRLKNQQECAATNLESCLAVLHDLLDYMNAGPEKSYGFQRMIREGRNHSYLDPKGPAVLRYTTMKYSDAGVKKLSDAANQRFPQADLNNMYSARLNSALVERVSLRQRAISVRGFELKLDKQPLAEMVVSLKNDIDRLESALQTCNDSAASNACEGAAEGALRSLAVINNELLYPTVATE